MKIAQGGAGITDRGPKYFYVLDGLRGVAAAAIVLRHTPRFFGHISLQDSFLAVDIFFVLSGFVLAANYESKFAAGMSVREFMMVRLIRLYPLYLLGLALGVLTAVLSLHHPGLEVKWSYRSLLFSFIPNFFMLPSLYSNNMGYLYPFNPVMWSIFFELVVNLFYVAAFGLLKDFRFIVALSVVSGLALAAAGLHYGSLNSGFDLNSSYVGLARVFYSFPVGVILYRVTSGRQPIPYVAPVVLFVLMVGLFSLRMNIDSQLFCVIFGFPAMIYVASLVPVSRIEKWIYGYLGMASYGIYALHKSFYQLILGAVTKSGAAQAAQYLPYFGIFFIILLFAAAILIELKFDSPSRSFLKRRLERPRLVPT